MEAQAVLSLEGGGAITVGHTLDRLHSANGADRARDHLAFLLWAVRVEKLLLLRRSTTRQPIQSIRIIVDASVRSNMLARYFLRVRLAQGAGRSMRTRDTCLL